jgi:hypothetical protein
MISFAIYVNHSYRIARINAVFPQPIVEDANNSIGDRIMPNHGLPRLPPRGCEQGTAYAGWHDWN